MRGLRRVAPLVAAAVVGIALLTGGAAARPSRVGGPVVEVVVTLAAPSLAEAAARDRTLAAATSSRGRLDLRAPASVSYVRRLASAQRALATRIAAAIPRAATR